MQPQCNAPAGDWLARHTRLAPDSRAPLAELAQELLLRLPARGPWLVGLGGPPGTGKSTLGRLLCHLLNHGHDLAWPVTLLSLDDYYLPAAERHARGQTRHPLMARRGPPGSHDDALLWRHIDALREGRPGEIVVPRFDKGRDDRDALFRRLDLRGQAHCVLLEGWFVGTPPQAESELIEPINALEARRDPDGRWRRWFNRQLAVFHGQLQLRLSAGWHLAAPDWDHVVRWRWIQEQERPVGQRMLHDRAAVMDFLAPFERLCRHQLTHDAAWADERIRLDTHHHPQREAHR